MHTYEQIIWKLDNPGIRNMLSTRDAKFRPGSAAGPQIQVRPGFCGARTKGAGIMTGLGEEITMYYALAAGLRAVLL